MSTLLGTSADWYLMRASGFVAFVLLTFTAALGIANVGRLGRSTWARTVSNLVHRNASLLAVVFLAVHIVTALSDRYVKVPALAVLVPGLSGYDPLWVGLGALSIDLFIAVTVTSLLRARIGAKLWRAVHWLAYLSWPTALLHAIGAGSGTGADTGRTWSTLIYVACAATFGIAATARMVIGRRPTVAEPGVRVPSRPAVTPRCPSGRLPVGAAARRD